MFANVSDTARAALLVLKDLEAKPHGFDARLHLIALESIGEPGVSPDVSKVVWGLIEGSAPRYVQEKAVDCFMACGDYVDNEKIRYSMRKFPKHLRRYIREKHF